jgi:hypothetical protein
LATTKIVINSSAVRTKKKKTVRSSSTVKTSSVKKNISAVKTTQIVRNINQYSKKLSTFVQSRLVLKNTMH